MSVVPLHSEQPSYDALAAEIELLRRQVRTIGVLHLMERFHAFDAIKDDRCPACGGRVAVKHDHNSVMLEAV